MSLPLIGIDENGFHSIHKNFTKISRYQTLKNTKIINTPKFLSYKNITPKFPSILNLTKNNHNMTVFQNRKKYNNIIRKNIFNHSIDKSNISLVINNNNIKNIFPSISNSKSNNSIEILTSLQNNKDYNKTKFNFENSLNLRKSFSETNILRKNKKGNQNTYFNKIKNSNNLRSNAVINNIDKILTKFKINKLIEKNSRNYCLYFENQNKLFNEKIVNTLFSSKFIDSEVKRGRNFIIGKNEKYFKKLNKHMIDIENSNKYKIGNSLEEIIQSLNEKDIKIILSDISYFRDINKNIVNILRNVRSNFKNNSLTKILNEEDGIKLEEKEKEKKEKLINEFDKENEYIKEILRKGNYERYLNKIMNNDFNKILQKINRKKSKEDIITENVNLCNLKARLINGKKYSEQDEKSEYACFRSFLNNISYDMTKKHFIENNHKRLYKEDLFKNKRKQIIQNKKKRNTILNYMELFKKIQKK